MNDMAAIPLMTKGATNWTTVCRVADIPPLGARRVAREKGAAVALFRTADDRVFALLDRCPHKGGPLSQGIVFGDRVACPLHNWSIGLCDGTAAAPDEGCTPKFALRVVDGAIELDAGELATLGTELTLPQAGPCLHTEMTPPRSLRSLPPEGASVGLGRPGAD